MKVEIDKDEWFQVFSVERSEIGFGVTVDIPVDELEEIENAFKIFKEAQEKLRKIYETEEPV